MPDKSQTHPLPARHSVKKPNSLMAHAQDAREHGSRPSYGGFEVIVRIEMHCQMQDESLSLRAMQACSRRGFLSTGVLAVAGGSMMPHQTTQAQSNSLIAAKKPVFVSTWNFGKPANEASLRRYNEGGSLLDAVEEGIRLTEADTSNASVGAGGKPVFRPLLPRHWKCLLQSVESLLQRHPKGSPPRCIAARRPRWQACRNSRSKQKQAFWLQ